MYDLKPDIEPAPAEAFALEAAGPAIPEFPEHRCPTCDYNLTGLTARRCPECGRAFTMREACVAYRPSTMDKGAVAWEIAQQPLVKLAGVVLVALGAFLVGSVGQSWGLDKLWCWWTVFFLAGLIPITALYKVHLDATWTRTIMSMACVAILVGGLMQLAVFLVK